MCDRCDSNLESTQNVKWWLGGWSESHACFFVLELISRVLETVWHGMQCTYVASARKSSGRGTNERTLTTYTVLRYEEGRDSFCFETLLEIKKGGNFCTTVVQEEWYVCLVCVSLNLVLILRC